MTTERNATMKKIRYTIIIIFVLSVLSVSGIQAEEFAKVGTVGTQFLKIPVGRVEWQWAMLLQL